MIYCSKSSQLISDMKNILQDQQIELRNNVIRDPGSASATKPYDPEVVQDMIRKVRIILSGSYSRIS